MLALIVRRLISLIPVLLVVSFVVFMLVGAGPGRRRHDRRRRGQRHAGADRRGARGARPRPSRARALRRLARRRGAARLRDARTSTQGGPTIAEEIKERSRCRSGSRSPASSWRSSSAIPLGILSGMRPGAVVDRASVTGTSIGLAIPNFVVAFFLITVFAIDLDWFPALGYTQVRGEPARSGCGRSRCRRSRSACSRRRRSRGRPAPRSSTCCSRTTCAPRSRSARARGSTVVKYAFKNAAIPTVTVLGLQLAGLLGGVVIIEQIFSIPGLGTYMLRALTLPDVPVIQAVTHHLRRDLRGDQPGRRHQLRLPQPAGARVVSRRDRSGPFPDDARRAIPRLVEDAGIAFDEGVVAHADAEPVAAGVQATAPRQAGDRRARVPRCSSDRRGDLRAARRAARPRTRSSSGRRSRDAELRTHPLGTDDLGRDTFSRIIYGARGVAALRVPDRVRRAALRGAHRAARRASAVAAPTTSSCG